MSIALSLNFLVEQRIAAAIIDVLVLLLLLGLFFNMIDLLENRASVLFINASMSQCKQHSIRN